MRATRRTNGYFHWGTFHAVKKSAIHSLRNTPLNTSIRRLEQQDLIEAVEGEKEGTDETEDQ